MIILHLQLMHPVFLETTDVVIMPGGDNSNNNNVIDDNNSNAIKGTKSVMQAWWL